MEREYVLLIHSILGVIIFLTGLSQLILKKGGKAHIIIGRIYVYSWIILLISGAYLGGLLITIVGVFGFYFALTGSRIGHLKTRKSTIFDKIIFAIGGLVSLAMLYYSVVLFLRGDTSFSIIFAVFGLLFASTAVEDIAKYILNKPLKKQIYGKSDWYFEHFTRMSISFIAAVTAFASIQNIFMNNTLNFLMPTVIGVILINLAKKSYKKKLKIG